MRALRTFLHLGAPGIDDDRAVAERARAELHPALEPADNLAVRDPSRRLREEPVVVQPLRLEPGGPHSGGALLLGVLARCGVLHHESARLAEVLVPDPVGGADRRARVAGRRLNEEAVEAGLGPDARRWRPRSKPPRLLGRGSAAGCALELAHEMEVRPRARPAAQRQRPSCFGSPNTSTSRSE